MWNSKPKSRSCSCTAKALGTPKYSSGTCYFCGSPRPAVVERIKGKREVRNFLAALKAGTDPEDL